MGISINYFFNWSGDLNQLAAQFRSWVGCNLQPYEDDSETLNCYFLGMDFSLYEHDLENDPGLNFEDYRFKAGIWPLSDDNFRSLQLITMASLVYALYRRLGIGDGILVFDVDLLLARYEQRPVSNREEGLYDSVSGEFVKYPQHMLSLMVRIPKGSFWAASDDEISGYLRKIDQVVKNDGT
jgi:hypothetical protein